MFIIKGIVFIAICFLGFNIVSPEYLNEFTGSIIDKYERLESIGGSRIVLIGDSNLVFGIDSGLLEDELKMPVVNMGLHAGLGNVFLERMARLDVHEDDIYVLSLHTYNDEGDCIGNCELAWITIENHYGLWKLLRVKDIPQMMRAFPVYLKKALMLWSEGTGNLDRGNVYSRSAFNDYGDCGIERKCEYKDIEPVKADSQVSDIQVKRINELNDYLSSKGATLVVAGYPIGNGEATDSADKFKAVSDTLKERLNCPVISDFTDYMYDYSYFYDYNYLHLNSDGAKIRTLQLAKDIKEWEKGR